VFMLSVRLCVRAFSSRLAVRLLVCRRLAQMIFSHRSGWFRSCFPSTENYTVSRKGATMFLPITLTDADGLSEFVLAENYLIK